MAVEKAVEFLQENICWSVTDVGAKQLGFEEQLAEAIAKACVQVMPQDIKKFDTDCVRCAKVIGASPGASFVVNGMCLVRDAYGTERAKKKCRVAVFGVGMEMTSTEAKATVLLNNADELMNYTKSEEQQMEDFVKELVDAKVDVVICQGSVQDIACHYLNKYKIMIIKISSKFDTKRLCKTLGAVALARLGKPLPEEIGGTKCVQLKTGDSRISTIVLRGATPHLLDELERAVDDAINLARCVVTRDRRFVPGGGAAEIELAHRLQQWGATVSGLEQYAALKFAECFEVVPKILAKNAGLNETKVITALYAAHASGQKTACVNLAEEAVKPIDASEAGIIDHYDTKRWAIRLAVQAAMTVLRVEHIIVAKQAGGPKQ